VPVSKTGGCGFDSCLACLKKARRRPKRRRFSRKNEEKRVAEKTEKKEKKDVKPNAIKRWWRETVGELRKVSWPTMQEAKRLTFIVLLVLVAMSALLGLLDLIFSELVTLLVA
jgi:preprotein translocase subunit SecE